jgi:hypothetical protein
MAVGSRHNSKQASIKRKSGELKTLLNNLILEATSTTRSKYRAYYLYNYKALFNFRDISDWQRVLHWLIDDS